MLDVLHTHQKHELILYVCYISITYIEAWLIYVPRVFQYVCFKSDVTFKERHNSYSHFFGMTPVYNLKKGLF